MNSIDIPQEPQRLGRLHQYSITGLFGTRNLDFQLDSQEPTILTGANGAGKSTILRTIDAVSTAHWVELFSIPFHRLELLFETGIRLIATQDGGTFRLHLSNEESWITNHQALRTQSYIQERISKSSHNVRNYQSKARRTSRTLVAGSVVTPSLFESLLRNLSTQDIEEVGLSSFSKMLPSGTLPPAWVDSLPQTFPVLFITDQRLVVENQDPSPDNAQSTDTTPTRIAVEKIAQQIASIITSARAEYGNLSQSIDREFPRRIIEAMEDPTKVSLSELQQELESLVQQGRLLQQAGLLTQDTLEEFKGLNFSPPNTRAAILTYIRGIQTKYRAQEPLRRRLALFVEFLDRHYKGKQVSVDSEHGLLIQTNGQDSPLSPARLSSGEQQILVLAHHILFRAATGTLVLIDEPELSLHVVWLSSLVDDLSEMGHERELAFILATHSPTLIAGREDLKRSLKG
jgi:ABC-type lipoprotein export system ATPase subunit